MLCRVRLMAHESSNCVGFQRGTPSHQGQTTEDDSSHDYRTFSQPTGSAASPCNACVGGSVAGCCNDTSTACAGSSGCPHFGQFMRKVSYGAHRWRLAASRNFTTGVTMAAAFCERSLSNNERRHRPAEVLRTASNRQIEIRVTTRGVPVTVSRGNAIARILEQALLLRCPTRSARLSASATPSAWATERLDKQQLVSLTTCDARRTVASCALPSPAELLRHSRRRK